MGADFVVGDGLAQGLETGGEQGYAGVSVVEFGDGTDVFLGDEVMDVYFAGFQEGHQMTQDSFLSQIPAPR